MARKPKESYFDDKGGLDLEDVAGDAFSDDSDIPDLSEKPKDQVQLDKLQSPADEFDDDILPDFDPDEAYADIEPSEPKKKTRRSGDEDEKIEIVDEDDEDDEPIEIVDDDEDEEAGDDENEEPGDEEDEDEDLDYGDDDDAVMPEHDARFLQMARENNLLGLQLEAGRIEKMELTLDFAKQAAAGATINLVAAKEEGDSTKEVAAQTELNKHQRVVEQGPGVINQAKSKLEGDIAAYKRGEIKNMPAPQAQAAQNQGGTKMGDRWSARQKWWNKSNARAKAIQGVAYAIDRQLTAEGEDAGSPAYYKKLSRALNKHFGKNIAVDVGGKVPKATGERRRNRGKASPVASQGAGRQGKTRRRGKDANTVTLNRDEVRFFENMGLNTEDPKVRMTLASERKASIKREGRRTAR